MKIIKFETDIIEEFETVDELFNISWIKEWSEKDQFLKFSRANKRLMAEWIELNKKGQQERHYQIIGRFLDGCDPDIEVFI